MTKKKLTSRPNKISTLSRVGAILRTIGTPPLFAIEIALYTLLWTGDHFIQLLKNGYFVLAGLVSTLLWLIKTTYVASRIFIDRFGSLVLNLAKKLQNKASAFRKKLKGLVIIPTTLTSFIPKKMKIPQIMNLLHSYARVVSFLLTIGESNLRWIKLHPWTIKFGKINVKTPNRASLKISPSAKLLPKHFTSRSPIFFFISGLLAFFLFLFIPYWAKTQLDQLPDPHLLSARDIPVSTKIYDRNGTLLYSFHSNEDRSIVLLDSLPSFVPAAHIAIEDHNFYQHFGFDPIGIVRAAFSNLIHKSDSLSFQGGSTITQQLIKSALLSPERTIDRKIKELVLSFWAERIYPKREILTMYLNQVPYGGAAYGIESAAETYFGKHASNLTLAEAALLAGLPSAPSAYSPLGASPELAKQRQLQVLTAMESQGMITPLQRKSAESEELKFVGLETSIKAPHFVMFVKDYLSQKYGLSKVEQGGLEVTTSLDYPTYEKVSRIVKDGVSAQKNLHVGNGATLVTNPKTGEILAMVGSTDYFDKTTDGNVNITTASRSPGSSIKPVGYALALEKGIITPSTIIDDSPIVYRIAGQPDYAPQNYDNRFHGKVTARVALASSYNIPAVKVLEKVGVENMRIFGQEMGITTWNDPNRFGLSLTLGSGEVKMTDMAEVYSAFANDGKKMELKPILKVRDYRGHILEDNTSNQYPATSTQVISPQTSFLISNILSDNAARSPTFGPSSALVVPGHTVAVKTGTAETKRDNWTIGYSFGDDPRLTVVWVGNNDNTPMSPFLESGNTGAAAIWNPIMVSLLANQSDNTITPPSDIIPVQICSLTGTLPCENCPSTRTEYFKKGTEPKVACNLSKEDIEKINEAKEKKENRNQ